MLITMGMHPKAMWPGIKAWFGKDYDEFPVQWTDLFDQDTSDKSYEEIVEDIGFAAHLHRANQFRVERVSREDRRRPRRVCISANARAIRIVRLRRQTH